MIEIDASWRQTPLSGRRLRDRCLLISLCCFQCIQGFDWFVLIQLCWHLLYLHNQLTPIPCLFVVIFYFRAAKSHALSVTVTQFDPFSHHTPYLTFLTLIFPHSILSSFFFHDNKLWSSPCRNSSNSDWLTEITNPGPIHQSFVPKSNQPREGTTQCKPIRSNVRRISASLELSFTHNSAAVNLKTGSTFSYCLLEDGRYFGSWAALQYTSSSLLVFMELPTIPNIGAPPSG